MKLRRSFYLATSIVFVLTLSIGACFNGFNVGPNVYCTADSDCLNDPAFALCDLSQHRCVRSLDGGDSCHAGTCFGSSPICDSNTNACRACATNDECKALLSGTDVCVMSGMKSGQCVACLTSTDCGTDTPVCDANQCRICRAHAECASRVCRIDGQCVDPNNVLYVDNRGMQPLACAAKFNGADGSQANPFCDTVNAVNAQKSAPYVHVAGSAQPYSALTLTALSSAIDLTIIGAGRSAMPPSSLAQSGSAALTVSAQNGLAAQVTVDGLNLIGSAGATRTDGVDCTSAGGGAMLTIKNSIVQDSGGSGVSSLNCALTLSASTVTGNGGTGVLVVGGSAAIDAATISANMGGGLSFTGSSTYDVGNTFVIGNGLNGRGVTIDDSSDGRFRFNTVASNVFGSNASGIACGVTLSKRIEDSIVVANGMAMNTQFAGVCQLIDVVAGSDALAPQTVTPDFKDTTTPPYDYHLVPNSQNNLKCCVDKVLAGSVDGGAAALPDHDVDLSQRPKGAGWDIGAHEVQ